MISFRIGKIHVGIIAGLQIPRTLSVATRREPTHHNVPASPVPMLCTSTFAPMTVADQLYRVIHGCNEGHSEVREIVFRRACLSGIRRPDVEGGDQRRDSRATTVNAYLIVPPLMVP